MRPWEEAEKGRFVFRQTYSRLRRANVRVFSILLGFTHPQDEAFIRQIPLTGDPCGTNVSPLLTRT